MCLAILKPAGKQVQRNVLFNGYISNSHGAGYAYAKNGKLVIRKGFFSFAQFIDSYDKNVTEKNSAIIHFRLATHGKQNSANCHPFRVTEDIAMIHNGIIPSFGDENESDTRQYVRLIASRIFGMIPKEHRNQLFKSYSEGKVGSGKLSELSEIEKDLIALRFSIDSTSDAAKLVFLNANGDYLINRPQYGIWEEGVWYSNSSGFYNRQANLANFLARRGSEIEFDATDWDDVAVAGLLKDISTDKNKKEDKKEEVPVVGDSPENYAG